jgi:hypothetical protein
MQPLPPWLEGGRRRRAPKGKGDGLTAGFGGSFLRRLRGPALVLAGAACPAPTPCATAEANATTAHPPHPHARAPRALALHALPAETGATEENRREALRAFAQTKASDLRGCLVDPGRGPLRRVGAALEIDAHGAVAAVQILGGDTGSREVESCYSAHLRAWRFPQALLQGDERLLVNFVL